MKYEIQQSKVNPDSWYVDDTEQKKSLAIFLAPNAKARAEEYAEFKNTQDKEKFKG